MAEMVLLGWPACRLAGCCLRERWAEPTAAVCRSSPSCPLAHMPAACLNTATTADWGDIAGQQTAKDLIQEVVVWPIRNPQLFTVRVTICVLAQRQRCLGATRVPAI